MAAGSGARLGADVPKAFVLLAGRTLLAWSLGAATACPGVACVVVVAPEAYLETARRECAAYALPPLVVAGGGERRDSVAAGLAALATAGAEVEVVLVHDAARALAPVDLFARVAAAVDDAHPAVIPGLPVVDTVKSVDADGLVTGTVDRAALRAVQTPQGFRRELLARAHAAAGEAAVTDDAALVEALGEPVLVVPGDPLALKITTPDDLIRAEAALAAPGS